MKKLSLYIHVPFCVSKCHYCSFNSYDNKDDLKSNYVEILIDEIKKKKKKIKKYEIETIYIGGGTPTSLSAFDLKKLLDYIEENLKLDKLIEYTIEVNPETINDEKINILKESAINRISIGLQTTQNKMLKKIGRVHTYEKFLEVYKKIRRYFDNINVDLIFSLPGQTMELLNKDLDEIIKLNPEHISCYSLSIEKGTKLYELNIKQNDIFDRKMYYHIIKRLKKNEYEHYEISNFAKKEKRSIHNTNYWLRKEYLGLGLGAHSLINKKRFSNSEIIDEYLKGDFENKNVENLTLQDEISEYVFLGMRILDGINIKKFKKEFNKDIFNIYGNEIDKLKRDDLIIIDGDYIKLTKKGIDLSNCVFEKFI